MDLVTGGDGQLMCACTWGSETRTRNVRLIESDGTRMLVALDEPVPDTTVADLAVRVDLGSATTAELRRYGMLLFSAAFGDQLWRELVDGPASDPYLELAIRGRADSEQPTANPLHAVRWEALHDDKTFVAARGVPSQLAKTVSIGIVRLVPPN